ncbi:MAG TPA: preprotein translocase subunit SecG [Anaerolineales bacterium]|nr:preprotein translocase subunit SecG [Anaerolineales bacterium]HRF47350.1 preprotein translocase subunit SecG [Anaerolineales bacterium]
MQLRDYFDIALIIVSIALVLAIILQSKSAGLGGLSGGDSGGVFRARRGVELLLLRLTIVVSVIFFALALVATIWVR